MIYIPPIGRKLYAFSVGRGREEEEVARFPFDMIRDSTYHLSISLERGHASPKNTSSIPSLCGNRCRDEGGGGRGENGAASYKETRARRRNIGSRRKICFRSTIKDSNAFLCSTAVPSCEAYWNLSSRRFSLLETFVSSLPFSGLKRT